MISFPMTVLLEDKSTITAVDTNRHKMFLRKNLHCIEKSLVRVVGDNFQTKKKLFIIVEWLHCVKII